MSCGVSAQIWVVFAVLRYRGPPQHRRVEQGVGAEESEPFSAGYVSAEEQEEKTEELLAELEQEPEKPPEQVPELV